MEGPSERKRRRKSRWAAEETDKTFIPGLPAVLPMHLNKEQEEAYVVQVQIEGINVKLRSGDLGIPANPEERSPSPEPIYSFDGKRLNTREYRTRKRLEGERHQLINRMLKLNPEFILPADYKPPLTRVSDKVMIPQDEHPDINFMGLLIGPRGNTLKAMEQETGAKIVIRGKGSVKGGKVGGKDGQPLPGENESLHAYVTASNSECVKKAVNKIEDIIRQGVEMPEGQNDLRRQQLRELALLNGTLRENDGRCTNCGANDHRSWACPDKSNVTMKMQCSICGGAGHLSRDCKQKLSSESTHIEAPQDRTKIDEEYMSLMAELGEAPHSQSDVTIGLGSNDRNRMSSGRLFERSSQPKSLNAPPSMTMVPNSVLPPMWNLQRGQSSNNAMPPPPPVGSMMMPLPMQAWQNMMSASRFQVPPPPPPMMNTTSSTKTDTITTTTVSAAIPSPFLSPWSTSAPPIPPVWTPPTYPTPVSFPANLPSSVLLPPPPPPPPPPSPPSSQ